MTPATMSELDEVRRGTRRPEDISQQARDDIRASGDAICKAFRDVAKAFNPLVKAMKPVMKEIGTSLERMAADRGMSLDEFIAWLDQPEPDSPHIVG